MKATFQGKILLFFYYTILLGGKAVTVPAPGYYGELKRMSSLNQQQRESNKNITQLLEFISLSENLAAYFDLSKIAQEHEMLVFESSIPSGYGMGSSGALVAGLWHAFGIHQKVTTNDALKDLLAEIESFFHGKSSGIDPITSYLGKPLLFDGNKPLQPLEDDNMGSETFAIGLIDLGKPSSTKHLVVDFLKTMDDDPLRNEQFQDYVHLTNELISDYISKYDTGFTNKLTKLSEAQLRWFSQMLTPRGVQLVEQSLNSSYSKIKLCGSGGGGFLLVFYKPSQKQHVEDELDGLKIIPL